MNREIIFRGKKVSDGEMVEGNLFYNISPLEEKNVVWENKYWIRSPLGVLSESFEVNHDTICQQTTTTIKHDTEYFKCFEGDIVEAYKWNEAKFELTVTFANGTFMFDGWTQMEFCRMFRRPKVIGNIFDRKVK